MPKNESTRPLSSRVPESLYETVAEMAKRRGVSVNLVVCEALSAAVAQERYQALKTGFEALQDGVEFAVAAQSEVVLADPE